MPDVGWEEASRCPKCSQPGKQVSVSTGPRGSKIHTLLCENAVCRWYNTTWIVQVRADGSVPIREPGEREFPTIPQFDTRAEAYIEQLRKDVERSREGRR